MEGKRSEEKQLDATAKMSRKRHSRRGALCEYSRDKGSPLDRMERYARKDTSIDSRTAIPVAVRVVGYLVPSVGLVYAQLSCMTKGRPKSPRMSNTSNARIDVREKNIRSARAIRCQVQTMRDKRRARYLCGPCSGSAAASAPRPWLPPTSWLCTPLKPVKRWVE